MAKPETVHDALYKQTFTDPMFRPLRDKLIRARRFVLDDSMSSFLSDLSHSAWLTSDVAKFIGVTENVRQLARLPHQITWIEFNMDKRQARTKELYSQFIASTVSWNALDPDQAVVEKGGWLLETLTETTFRATQVMYDTSTIVGVNKAVMMPFSYVWSVDNNIPNVKRLQIPGKIVRKHPDGLMTEFPDASETQKHNTAAIGFDRGFPGTFFLSPSMMYNPAMPDDDLSFLINEVQGELRHIWALLASINDIPVGIKETIVSKGFVARGQYKHFLHHSVITLNVPKTKDIQKLARILVAISRRCGHEVRGHFQRFGAQKVRRWVKEHVRGDATLGWTTHEYAVKHGGHVREKKAS